MSCGTTAGILFFFLSPSLAPSQVKSLVRSRLGLWFRGANDRYLLIRAGLCRLHSIGLPKKQTAYIVCLQTLVHSSHDTIFFSALWPNVDNPQLMFSTAPSVRLLAKLTPPDQQFVVTLSRRRSSGCTALHLHCCSLATGRRAGQKHLNITFPPKRLSHLGDLVSARHCTYVLGRDTQLASVELDAA